ncbi:hypothetical protein ACFSBZ_08910 [Amnibacterium flavum]|uniref:Uncharacterized protein n=1 Tax=Amnibacterium flavum TaxID=2173173 RepID=A0A2V1HVB2_9MICO|nr:hypothetical protein [Amnibacterium flavum]PVZ94989.1 hypothetical protein DDQ50_00150 [Amnibacterium flavum]
MDELLPTLVTIAAAVVGYFLRYGQEKFRAYRARQAYAFVLFPGVGEDWLLRALHKGRYEVKHLSAWDARGRSKPISPFLINTEMLPQSAGYAVGVSLDPGDTFEVHWVEGRDGEKSYSTFIRIWEGEREYRLRRENTGH